MTVELSLDSGDTFSQQLNDPHALAPPAAAICPGPSGTRRGGTLTSLPAV